MCAALQRVLRARLRRARARTEHAYWLTLHSPTIPAAQASDKAPRSAKKAKTESGKEPTPTKAVDEAEEEEKQRKKKENAAKWFASQKGQEQKSPPNKGMPPLSPLNPSYQCQLPDINLCTNYLPTRHLSIHPSILVSIHPPTHPPTMAGRKQANSHRHGNVPREKDLCYLRYA